ncbi:hypothetical protein CK203_103813 [Vitis vinifera]|uniref:Uncharacterized protein n=1 Tax=Vitis vinifera TaxID=29760 RepID=A0A438CTL9_VITVI|nr:hypothetical protein CK203_103813 [Vitis vinifera]
MVYELLRTSTDAPLASTPVWAREFSSSEELITEFVDNAELFAKVWLVIEESNERWKAIIIENILCCHQAGSKTLTSQLVLEEKSLRFFGGNTFGSSIYLMDDDSKLSTNMTAKVEEPNSLSVKSDDNTAKDNVSKNKGEAVKDPETDTNPPAGKEKSVAEPIIVPIVLKMAEFDHKVWLNS